MELITPRTTKNLVKPEVKYFHIPNRIIMLFTGSHPLSERLAIVSRHDRSVTAQSITSLYKYEKVVQNISSGKMGSQ